MFCRFCGKQIPDDAEYCSYCGRKVLRVPPVFTMTDIGTGVATDAIRNYSEWGFYNNPDAELNPETGQRRETEFDTLKTLPEENPIKWARDFMEADKAESGDVDLDAEDEEYEDEEDGEAPQGSIFSRISGRLSGLFHRRRDEEAEEDDEDEDEEDDIDIDPEDDEAEETGDDAEETEDASEEDIGGTEADDGEEADEGSGDEEEFAEDVFDEDRPD